MPRVRQPMGTAATLARIRHVMGEAFRNIYSFLGKPWVFALSLFFHLAVCCTPHYHNAKYQNYGPFEDLASVVGFALLVLNAISLTSLLDQRRERAHRLATGRFCAACDYDLSALGPGPVTCPECGNVWEPPQHSPGSDA